MKYTLEPQEYQKTCSKLESYKKITEGKWEICQIFTLQSTSKLHPMTTAIVIVKFAARKMSSIAQGKKTEHTFTA